MPLKKVSINFKRTYPVAAGAAIFYISFVIFADATKTIEQFVTMKLEFIPLLLAIEISVLFLRTIRNRFLLKSLGINISFKRNLLIYLAAIAMAITPGGTGEVVRSQFLKMESGRSIASTAPVYFTERFHDLISIVSIMIVFILFFPLREGWITIGIASVVVTVFYLVAKNRKIFETFSKILGKIPRIQRLAAGFDEMRNSFEVILDRKILGKTYLYSVPIWFLHGLTAYVAFLAFDIDLHLMDVYVVYFTSLVIGTLTFIPSGIGITESSLAGLLSLRGIQISMAVALALLIRLITLWFAVFVGIISSKIFLAKRSVEWTQSDHHLG